MFKIDLSEETPLIDKHHDQFLNAPLNFLRPKFSCDNTKDTEIMTKMFFRIKEIVYAQLENNNDVKMASRYAELYCSLLSIESGFLVKKIKMKFSADE